MKKLLNWRVIFIVGVLSVFLFPLFHFGIYITHDGEANIARFAAYFKAFSDLQFPPRWAGDLNFGYGSPVFIFYYPLPGYISSALHLFGISFADTFKIIMGVSFILNGLFFYLWSKKIFRKDVALITSIIYAFSPYHLLDMYVRGDVAEILALSIIPLVFLSIEKFIEKKGYLWLLRGGFFYALLILSHNGISLTFTPLFIIYCFFRAKNMKILFNLSLIFILGLCLSAFFWIPAIMESSFVNAKLFIGDNFKSNFLNFNQIVFSKWGFGPDVNSPGGLAPQIGIVYISSLIISSLIFLRNLKKERLFGFWICAFIVTIFMTTSYSFIFWKNINTLKLLEFPWRFIAVASFTASAAIGYLLNLTKNKIILFSVLLVFLISVVPFIKTEDYEIKSDSFYNEYPYTTYFHGEASSVWTAGDFSENAKNQFEVISGRAKILNINKKSALHTFLIDADNNTRILDNTVYFPGWRVSIDNKKVPIEFQDINHRGLITFSVPEGKHLINIRFEESLLRLLADIISVVALILFILGFVFRKKIKNFFNKL